MLSAAEATFAERGFDAATTKEIATRAGVTEQVLYNQFASKAGVFEATVLGPFQAFADAQIEHWRAVSVDALDPHEMLAGYIADLFRLVRARRPLFLALGEERFGAPIEAVLERLDDVAREMCALHGFAFDVETGIRAVYAATTTLALHQPTLLPAHDEDRIVAELQRMLVTGLLRPA